MGKHSGPRIRRLRDDIEEAVGAAVIIGGLGTSVVLLCLLLGQGS